MIMAGKPGDRDRLYGLDERLASYRDLTNTTFQYLLDIEVLRINQGLSVSVLTSWSSEMVLSPDYTKSANRLGKLFSPFDVPTIYRMLGVKRL